MARNMQRAEKALPYAGLPGGRVAAERETMIREEAYYRYARRGFTHGHDLEDWLAAEKEVDRRAGERQGREEIEMPEFEVQQSAARGPWRDEALKRISRQHPQRDMPRVEGIEPQGLAPSE